MRVRMNDSRKQRYETLTEATGEKTKSKALDKAAAYYIKMRGDTVAVPNGRVSELMALATRQGSVTPAEIADCLDVDELPVCYESSWSVGEDSD
ncbi:hypothetical protein AUR64_02100 [Haloprofundus marisrubri]|uniref:Uncharacterized protein n=1 Tax=Haloprofundus marisrubri TaxID=1514971 RepID=A0A0W1R344_9EURY|nr:hypothetical protein AUR64_02100 [Haloprofundus marisrubri]